ncbi:MAG: hypothetical protein ACLP0J_15595 [Solirubrobacteraceae bacterium]
MTSTNGRVIERTNRIVISTAITIATRPITATNVIDWLTWSLTAALIAAAWALLA